MPARPPVIPPVVRISGRPWRTVKMDLTDQEAQGLSDSGNGTIAIHETHESLFAEQDTVLHEVMHSVFRQQGRPYTQAEERFVTALTPGLLGVLHDNPELVKYLLRKRP